MGQIQFCKISKLGVCVFLFYVLWFKFSYFENKIILYGSIGIAAFCMFVDFIMSDNNASLLKIPWGVMVNLVMSVYSLFTGIWVARNLEVLNNSVKTYFCFSLMIIIICYISQQENSIDWVLNALIGVCLVSSLYVILRGYYWYGYGYTLSRDNNPNGLGVLMDIGIFCAIYRSKGKTNILVYLGMIALFAYIIIGCGSRKCLIAAGIICMLGFFPLFKDLWNNGSQLRRMMLVVIVAILVYSIYYYFTHVYITSDSYQRMQMLGDSEEGSSGHRMLYYQYAIDYCMEHPFFGIGLNQFQIWNPFRQYSHSTYAEAIADWGVIGCIIYFMPPLLTGIRLIRLLFEKTETYIIRVILALWATEIFLGIGQIWFFEPTHLIVWTIMYISIEALVANDNTKRGCKYVKG